MDTLMPFHLNELLTESEIHQESAFLAKWLGLIQGIPAESHPYSAGFSDSVCPRLSLSTELN